ncbi:MAG TPA: 50S ribosomal protein L29 [Nocardioidaceae bacterium]|nr:50S ribosomal protein L29 [Nocardioidaceae bacterium]
MDKELAEKLSQAKEELFNLRFQSATGQLESHGRLRLVRREIARIYTILRERELGITENYGDETDDDEAAATEQPPSQEQGAS